MSIKNSQNEFVELRTLCIGFDGKNLDAIRKNFNVQYSIAESSQADLNWHALHNLQLPHSAPNLNGDMLACLSYLFSNYKQFVDINSRRHYYVPGREAEIYNGMLLTFYKIYELLKEKKIQIILHANIPHEGFDFLIHKIACYLKIASVLCYQSLIPNRFWMSENIESFGLHSRIPVIFELEKSSYQLPNSWFYMRGIEKDSAYSFKQMISEVIGRPYRIPPALIRYLFARQFRQEVRRITSLKVKGEPYIYFPLHLQPELTTAAVGGMFADQILALELLSSLMPDGHYIYVKENPKQTEKQRGKLFYKRLAALKNVRVIPLIENSLELIKGSIGVATITGTAGWEALFYGKPVLVFGAAWYREFPGVLTYSRDFNYFHFIKSKPPAAEALVSLLDKALTSAGRGIVDPAYSELVAEFDELRSAQQVAISLKRHVVARLNDII